MLQYVNMKNDYTLNIAEGQSGASATIKVWDYETLDRRDCLIDAADLPIVEAITGTWTAKRARGNAQKWYAQAKVSIAGKSTTIQMHRLITGATDPAIEIDHADNDGLNNQRYNLRKCNHQQNIRFRQPDKDWAAHDAGKVLAEEYRLERNISAGVQSRFDISRQTMYSIRLGKTLTSPAALKYKAECAGRCRSLAEMKTGHEADGRKWGAR